MYEVDGKEIDIFKENWNILIILDACRYDFFSDIYRQYYDNGTLDKAISPATTTSTWLHKIFGNNINKDLIYLSANPQIRKKMLHDNDIPVDSRFFKIVDVWKDKWSEKLGTVHPKEMNKAFHNTYMKYPNKRYILHYLQPHAPYIPIGGHQRTPTQRKKVFYFSQKNSDLINKAFKATLGWRYGIFWKIEKEFGIEPQHPIGKVWYKYGDQGLKYIYKENLILALKYVKMLTDGISTKWLITSDHGERLGENLKYSHGGPRDKEVIEVPWFKLET